MAAFAVVAAVCAGGGLNAHRDEISLADGYPKTETAFIENAQSTCEQAWQTYLEKFNAAATPEDKFLGVSACKITTGHENYQKAISKAHSDSVVLSSLGGAIGLLSLSLILYKPNEAAAATAPNPS